MASRTIGFTFGALLCHQLGTLPDPALTALCLLLLPALFAQRAIAVPAAFMLGIAWSATHAHVGLTSRMPAHLHGTDLLISGTVIGVPQAQPSRLRFRLRLDAVESAAAWRWHGCELDLSWYRPSEQLLPRAGERWQATVRLRQPRGLRNPGAYDVEHRALREATCAIGYLRPALTARRLAPARAGIDPLRAWIAGRIDRQLEGLPARGVVKALAVGVRADVTPEQSRLLQVTGTAHLMAISGLHVGLVAGLGLILGRGLARIMPGALTLAPAAHWGAILALVSATAYAALAGFSIPTQRALIMLLVVLGASLARRRWQRSAALCVALLCVLLTQPLAVYDPGTWLSFVAVAGLMWAIWPARLAAGSALRQALGNAWQVQVAACLVLVPITLLCFGFQSLSAPLANLIAVPVTGLLAVPMILAGVAVDLSGLDRNGMLLRAGAHTMGVLLEALQRLPAHDRVLVSAAPPGALALGAAFAGIAVALLPVSWRVRAVSLVWLAPLLLPATQAPSPDALSIRVLDVGQGLASIVRTHQHVLVFDAGPSWSAGSDAGARIVTPALQRDGIRRVDRLVVSHPHDDHAGGVRGLMRSIAIDDVLGDPGVAGAPATPCVEGLAWNWNGYRFSVLHPDDRSRVRGNDASCVLHVSGPGGSVLLPADIEASAESRLVRELGTRLAAQVLIVPHHGSHTSSSAAFLAAVQPQLAVNSSGHRNRFGHPRADVIARYRQHGITLYDTACSGQVWIHLQPGAPPEIRTWQQSAMRFWHSRDTGTHCNS